MSPFAIAPHSKPAYLAIDETVFDSHDEYIRIRITTLLPEEVLYNS